MVPSVACSGHGDVAIVPMLNPAAVTVADIFCADAKREARAGRVPSVGNRETTRGRKEVKYLPAERVRPTFEE
jgi:hypothetical protein